MSDHLQQLWVQRNAIETIPTEIGLMTEVVSLRLRLNPLADGSLPSELWHLTKLTDLDIGSMQLSTIPTEIFQLTKLEVLSLDSGLLPTIPSELLQNLTSLEDFFIFADQSSQTPSSNFPTDIFDKAEFITDLDLSARGLQGSIPSQIGLLTNCEGLILSANNLTGSIPSEIGLMTSLR